MTYGIIPVTATRETLLETAGILSVFDATGIDDRLLKANYPSLSRKYGKIDGETGSRRTASRTIFLVIIRVL